jgi:hypothetical protein
VQLEEPTTTLELGDSSEKVAAMIARCEAEKKVRKTAEAAQDDERRQSERFQAELAAIESDRMRLEEAANGSDADADFDDAPFVSAEAEMASILEPTKDFTVNGT